MKNVNEYTKAINSAVSAAKKSSVKVFKLLKDARKVLSAEEYEKLKKAINVSSSTITKIEKIFANDIVMKNIEILPVSWGTLYEIARLDDVQTLIDDGKLNDKTTAAKAKELNTKISKTATGEAEETAAETIEEETEQTATAAPKNITITLEVKGNISKDVIKSDIAAISRMMEARFKVDTNLDMFLGE